MTVNVSWTLSLGAVIVMLMKTMPLNVSMDVVQVNYILGSTGRSFVVGYGVNPPTHCHHRGASCYGPNR